MAYPTDPSHNLSSSVASTERTGAPHSGAAPVKITSSYSQTHPRQAHVGATAGLRPATSPQLRYFDVRFLDAAGIERSLTHGAPEDLPLDDFCACFARGTLIEGEHGPIAVEDLSPGDMIQTKDSGLHPLRWLSSCRLSAEADDPRLPIRIRADAMGELRPMQDLVVSRRFRFLVARESCRALFGQDEMLSPVQSFVDGDNITELYGRGDLDFFNLMLDAHQVIFANGLETESFHPGTYGIATMSTEMRHHLARMLPHMSGDLTTFGPVARQRLRSFEAELLHGV